MCLSMFVAGQASAQGVNRFLPKDLVVAKLKANGGSVVVLLGDNNRAVRLSPAAQIRGVENRLILPVSFRGEFVVGLKWDLQGMLSRIWILRPAEYTALTGKPYPDAGSTSDEASDDEDSADDDSDADDDTDQSSDSDSVNG